MIELLPECLLLIYNKKRKTWVKVGILADSRLIEADIKRFYIKDSTTIGLFKDILRGVGRNPKEGRKAE